MGGRATHVRRADNVAVQITPEGGVIITPVAPPATPPAGQQPPATTPAPAAEPEEVALTNDKIIEMEGANVAPSVIIGAIRASKTNFIQKLWIELHASQQTQVIAELLQQAAMRLGERCHIEFPHGEPSRFRNR